MVNLFSELSETLRPYHSFSLLLAELMIGTLSGRAVQ